MAKKKKQLQMHPNAPGWNSLNPPVRAMYWSARTKDSDYDGPLNPRDEARKAWMEAAEWYDKQDGKEASAEGARRWSEYYDV